MALLEREEPLGELLGALRRAEAGQGSTALVSGEAGVGKTTLVRAFAEGARGRARLLTAACDDLITPRALGPLRDVFGDSLDGDRAFTAVMAELARERPTVLVIEDAHWADDATLDVLGYAARRVGSVGALLVLTVRDEAIVPGHPLHRLFGMLAGEPVHRLRPAPFFPGPGEGVAGGPRRGPPPRP